MSISDIASFLITPAVLSATSGLSLLGTGYKISKEKNPSTLEKVIKSGTCIALGGYFLATGVADGISNSLREQERGSIDVEGTKDQGLKKIYKWLSQKSESNNNQECLVLQASGDHTEALKPTAKYNLFFWSQVESQCRVTFRNIKSPEELCKTIQETRIPGGTIDNLFVDAHGNPNLINLNDVNLLNKNTNFPQGCFSSLREDAHVFLLSCDAGKKLNDGIAAHMARQTGKTVISSDTFVSSLNTHVSDLGNPNHPTGGLQFSDPHEKSIDGKKSDHTVVCTPKGTCHVHNMKSSLSKILLLNPFYYIMQNSTSLLFQNVLATKVLSQVCGHVGNIIDIGTDILSPYVKKATNDLTDHKCEGAVDAVGDKVYKISKLSAKALSATGEVSNSIESATRFLLKTAAKTIALAGQYLEKRADALSSALPKSCDSKTKSAAIIAAKIVIGVGKIGCRLLNWTGRGLGYMLG